MQNLKTPGLEGKECRKKDPSVLSMLPALKHKAHHLLVLSMSADPNFLVLIHLSKDCITPKDT